MSKKNLLTALIRSSERAANIARKCRKDVALLSLLVQEKTVEEANPRFVQDFKTLADVLIQEAVRHEIGELFPELKDNIKGEETASFTNKLGHTITVVIGENVETTAACLERVLDGNRLAAELLAHEVHKQVENPESGGVEVPDLPDNLDYSKIGIWIDPIDSTSEYISGETVFSDFPGITSTGLDCVTVLIGAYDIETGIPIFGVINQPFSKKTDVDYDGKIFWGLKLGNICAHNIPPPPPREAGKIALFSTSEHATFYDIIKSQGYEIAFSAGAGHKILKVITGDADIYVLSKGTTYKWDTCGPQAILTALGGVFLDFQQSVKEKLPIDLVGYASDEKANRNGLIAIRNPEDIESVLNALAN